MGAKPPDCFPAGCAQSRRRPLSSFATFRTGDRPPESRMSGVKLTLHGRSISDMAERRVSGGRLTRTRDPTLPFARFASGRVPVSQKRRILGGNPDAHVLAGFPAHRQVQSHDLPSGRRSVAASRTTVMTVSPCGRPLPLQQNGPSRLRPFGSPVRARSSGRGGVLKPQGPPSA